MVPRALVLQMERLEPRGGSGVLKGTQPWGAEVRRVQVRHGGPPACRVLPGWDGTDPELRSGRGSGPGPQETSSKLWRNGSEKPPQDAQRESVGEEGEVVFTQGDPGGRPVGW